MDPHRFSAFTDEIVSNLAADRRVLGVVALGSTAATERAPDPFSDHDLWVVTVDGAGAELRDDRSWLPTPDRIVVHAVESPHGRQIVYDDGHLVEVAVFDDSELEVARVNAFRVLDDRGGITDRVAAMADRTRRETTGEDPRRLLGRFVAQLTIGVNRAGRGELTSANQLIRGAATLTLTHLVATVAGESADVLDDLDPARRFEQVFPDIAHEIESAVRLAPIDAADALVNIARPHVDDLVGGREAIDVIAVTIERCRSGPRTDRTPGFR